MTTEHKPQREPDWNVVMNAREDENDPLRADHRPAVTRITVIHDDGDSAVYDVSEIRIGHPAIVTIEYGQLVIRPGDDE